MGEDHTVRSYDGELNRLSNLITRMGGLAEAQLDAALQALSRRDSDLAGRVIAGDAQIDALEHDVHAMTVRMLALRQPVAQDLRQIVGALKISGDLERIADYAANVAKRTLVLNQLPPVRPVSAVPRLGQVVLDIIHKVLDAYIEQDCDKAIAVWRQDEEVDALYTGLFRELITYMMEDPRNITPCIHLMFMAKNIERIGDHATNIAESVYFAVKGKPIPADRPKGNTVSLPGMLPGTGA